MGQADRRTGRDPRLPAITQGIRRRGADPPGDGLRQRLGTLQAARQRQAGGQRFLHARLDRLQQAGVLQHLRRDGPGRAGGPNAIGADLAAGWYAGAIGWKKEGRIYGELCSLFVQLEIELADGTVQTVVTDPSWKFAYGPRIEGEFLPGETYDARLRNARLGPARLRRRRVEARRRRRVDQGEVPGLSGRARSARRARCRRRRSPSRSRAVRLRSGPELRRLRAAEGQGARRHEESCSGSPRCSIPTGRSTRPISAARGAPTRTSCAGDGEEVWQPRVHVPRVPLRRGDRLSRHARRGRHDRHRRELATPAGRLVRLLQPDGQPALQQHRVDAAGELHRRADRLPATRRAARLDGRRPGVRPRGHATTPTSAAFFTKWLVDVDDAQRADGSFTDVSPDLAGLGSGTAGWADAGVDLPLDHLLGLQRPPRVGRALSRDGPLHRLLRETQQGPDPPGRRLRRLALDQRRHAQGPAGHRLLRPTARS